MINSRVLQEMSLGHIVWNVLKVSMFGFRVLQYENKKKLQKLQCNSILSSDHIFQRLYVFLAVIYMQLENKEVKEHCNLVA